MRRSFLSICLLVFVAGCELINGSSKGLLPVERDIIADGFGNCDGLATEDELRSLDEHFRSYSEAWALGGFPTSYLGKTQIPASEVLNELKRTCLVGPFKSKEEMKKYFDGMGIRGVKCLAVGIFVFVSKPAYGIRDYYMCPGGSDFINKKWVHMKIMEG